MKFDGLRVTLKISVVGLAKSGAVVASEGGSRLPNSDCPCPLPFSSVLIVDVDCGPDETGGFVVKAWNIMSTLIYSKTIFLQKTI